MKFEITKEELDFINSYKNEKYLVINQLLASDADTDISLTEESGIQYTKEFLEENINLIKTIFKIIVKKSNSGQKTFFRSTNIAEIDKLKNEQIINNFFFASVDKNPVNNNLVRPVIMQIHLDENVSNAILEDNQVMISPFTVLTNIEELSVQDFDNNSVSSYMIELKMQELDFLSEEDKDELYKNILEKTDIINEKIGNCIEFDNESSDLYENIRKLEQLLEKHTSSMEQFGYEQDTSPEEKQSDIDDVIRINSELKSIKNQIAEIYSKRQEASNFISDWKNDILTYLKAEFRQMLEDANPKEMIEEISQEDIQDKTEEKLKPIGNQAVDDVKKETAENIAVINTLLENIKNLISNQQNHARIADLLDSNYKALNNAFEMKNYAEELEALYQAIANKLDLFSLEDGDELNNISKTNLQVSILLNYLNNPKTAVSKKIKRFDEINIIEENELKKEIAETIKNIRCEAELKKLRDDIEIIEDKSTFKKFIGRFTGRNKLDMAMMDQIQIRQKAIKKTFKTKLPLAHNYSIHNIIAEIEMFIRENEDDELVLEDISNLRKIEQTLKKNFVISDSKVETIVAQKTGKNLPLRF